MEQKGLFYGTYSTFLLNGIMKTLLLSCSMHELGIFTNIARLCKPLQKMFLIKGLFTYVVQFMDLGLCDSPLKEILLNNFVTILIDTY